MFLFSALLPSLTVLLGAGIYYLLFPDEIYVNTQALFDFCVQYGFPAGIAVNPGAIATAAIMIWLVSIAALPIHLLELGEEIGWRGYLLPQLLKFMDVKKLCLQTVFFGDSCTRPLYTSALIMWVTIGAHRTAV